MAANKWILITLITALISACGSNTNQAPLPGDGTYADQVPATGGDPYANGFPGETGIDLTPTPGASGVPGSSVTAGYTLKGIVTDRTGKLFDSAKVSIGSVTILTKADGSFEITGIMDNQVQVDVMLDGYQAITAYAVNFTPEAPVADKEFKLAEKTGSSDSDDSDSNSGADGDDGFSHEASFSSKKFKSVASMVVSDDVVYILGVVDGFLFLNHNSVVMLNADTGAELKTFSKIGFLKHLPKAADSLAVEDDEIRVSDTTTTFVFDAGGQLQSKGTGGRKAPVTEVEDDERNIDYELKSGNKVAVKVGGKSKTYALGSEVSSAKAIGLDSSGNLLVLDSAARAVHKFSFKK